MPGAGVTALASLGRREGRVNTARRWSLYVVADDGVNRPVETHHGSKPNGAHSSIHRSRIRTRRDWDNELLVN